MVAVWGKGWLRAVLSNPRLVWLGKISYGLYMYHELALWARERYLDRLPWFPNKTELLSIAALALTIAIAAASYYGYERRFLQLKRGVDPRAVAAGVIQPDPGNASNPELAWLGRSRRRAAEATP